MVNGQTDAKFFAINTVYVAYILIEYYSRTRARTQLCIKTVAYKWGIKFESPTHAIEFGSLFWLIGWWWFIVIVCWMVKWSVSSMSILR